MRTVLLIFLAVLFSGCATLPKSLPAHKPLPKMITLVWSRSAATATAINEWEAEISRRWPDREVAVVFCHGDDSANGKPWCITPDAPMRRMPVENAAAFLHAILPGRLIVFITCNGGAAGISTPDVAFSRRRVWTYPGKDRRWIDIEGCYITDTGNIFEFEVTK